MSEIKVIKIGGKVIQSEAKLDQFLHDFEKTGGKKILVHGGGNLASEIADQLGVQSKMVSGRRITDAKMLEVATMTYAGLVNKKIVAKLQALRCNALGLTGADLDLIRSVKRSSNPIDFGMVGDIQYVNSEILIQLLNMGITPVVAPLTHNGKDQLLNTNADNVASYIACSLVNHSIVSLDLCLDLQGVLNGDELVTEMNLLLYRYLKGMGKITNGMIPKVDLGFKALNEGVINVRILGFDTFKNKKAGTRIVK
ncbi:acetylglutamate kinase [Balneola vulgaris]|jgi:acetylglutamate kinase|uniref:acetylglutamate kinase n=1 Tax=Balneola vulgaris TaxID=287535 RepID=UPI00036442C4|nr:acetylglutamate kinase [Balneola vulgaris]